MTDSPQPKLKGGPGYETRWECCAPPVARALISGVRHTGTQFRCFLASAGGGGGGGEVHHVRAPSR